MKSFSKKTEEQKITEPLGKEKAINVQIGKNIQKRRFELGYKLIDVSELTSISYQRLQKYETGSTTISAQVLYLLAKTLDCPAGVFYEGLGLQDYKEFRASRIERGTSIELTHLIKSFSKLKNKKIKRSIVQLIDEITDPFENND